MKVSLIQLVADLDEDPADRLARGCDLVRAERDADLVVLPELWVTGFFDFDAYPKAAEPLDGPIAAALADAARTAGTWLHGGSIIEAGPDGSLYNTALLFDPGGRLAHIQRKVHVFGYRSREAELLRGADTLAPVDTPFGTVGMTTCYDLRFPEVYRVLVDGGATLLVVAAAWPAARLDHWRLLARARAVENQCFLLGCNAAGRQGRAVLAGHSVVVDPWGVPLAEAGQDEQVLRADFDPAQPGRLRAEFPALRDRRLFVTPTLTNPPAAAG